MGRALLGTLAAMALLAGSAHAKTGGHLVEVAGPEWAQAAVHNMRVPVVPNQAVILAACPRGVGVQRQRERLGSIDRFTVFCSSS
jgi:hypothetical protein